MHFVKTRNGEGRKNKGHLLDIHKKMKMNERGGRRDGPFSPSWPPAVPWPLVRTSRSRGRCCPPPKCASSRPPRCDTLQDEGIPVISIQARHKGRLKRRAPRTIDGASRVGITVGSVEDGTPAQLAGLLDGEIELVSRIEYTVCVRATGSHGESVALQTSTIAVHVEDAGSLLMKKT